VEADACGLGGGFGAGEGERAVEGDGFEGEERGVGGGGGFWWERAFGDDAGVGVVEGAGGVVSVVLAEVHADAEGDEIVIRLDQFGRVIDFTNLISNKVEEIFYLYLIYYLTDDGRYEFYAELTDEEGLNEIMSDEEEDEEE
jgi:hypothetical protein